MKSLSIGDIAPNAQVLDKDGQTVELASRWASGLILLTFLRHFG